MPGLGARRQHVAIPAVAGQLAEALDWLIGALERCPDISALRVRALFAAGVLHLRRADIEPVSGVAEAITAASRGLGEEAVTIAGDQVAILTLMAHDWADATRLSTAALAEARSSPSTAVCARHFAAVLALALGEVDEARGLLRDAAAALDRVPEASPRSSPR